MASWPPNPHAGSTDMDRGELLPSRVQKQLTAIYGLDEAPDVMPFVKPVQGTAREVLFVREAEGTLELMIHLPRRALGRKRSLDGLCQVVEGVSHFLYLAHRARRELPTTELELELQAEVDKFVLLAIGAPDRATLFVRLFEEVSFVHPKGTERGDRYRLANHLAAKMAKKLVRDVDSPRRQGELLRRFYHAGQTEKIELARAA